MNVNKLNREAIVRKENHTKKKVASQKKSVCVQIKFTHSQNEFY